jgi:drug/metabolite transporter (DMT)-like permease
MLWGMNETVPVWSTIAGELWWLLPFVILVLMTGVFTSMWGVPKLSPNLVTLLYMTEISTAAVTAALLSDEEFTLLDGIGVTLIALAGAFTSIWHLLLGPKAALATSRQGD